jgi:acetyl esterase/lipase
MRDRTVRDLIESGEYGIFADYFWSFITEDHLDNTLDAYGYEATAMELGLQRCAELVKEDRFLGKSFLHDIYTRQEIYKNHELQEAKFFFFPRKSNTDITINTDRAFALVIPGGGFARQWTLIEGFSIAARLNELGISAFVMQYRTAQNGVVPKALEDMYRAISYISENEFNFNVNGRSYIAGGFSAGATLAGALATDNLGWKAHNLPKPELLFLGYPAQRMDLLYNIWATAPVGSPARTSIEDFLKRLVPGEITEEAVAPFILENHLSKDICPPLYITANDDDPTVPVINSKSLFDTATAKGIPVKAKFGHTGGHSYGLGCGLEVDGWLDDAVNFWQSQR